MNIVSNHNCDLFHYHPIFKTWRRILCTTIDHAYFINILPRPSTYFSRNSLILKGYQSLNIVRVFSSGLPSSECHKGIDEALLPEIEKVYGKEIGNILVNVDIGLSDPKIVEKLNDWFNDSSDLRIHGIPAMYLFDDDEIFTKSIREEMNRYILPQVKFTMEALLTVE